MPTRPDRDKTGGPGLNVKLHLRREDNSISLIGIGEDDGLWSTEQRRGLAKCCGRRVTPAAAISCLALVVVVGSLALEAVLGGPLEHDLVVAVLLGVAEDEV
jgi:hypothetical protein